MENSNIEKREKDYKKVIFADVYEDRIAHSIAF